MEGEGEEGKNDKGNSPPQPFFHYKGKNTDEILLAEVCFCC